MKASQKLYEDFYASRFNGRKLLWQNSLSSCILNINLSEGQKEISCNLSQAIVLLLFNERETASFSEIQNSTGLGTIAYLLKTNMVNSLFDIATKELISLLNSLSSKPHKLIINESSEATTELDRFSFNSNFESQSNKIKLPLASGEQITDDQKDVEKKVQQNRQYQLEAAIVRIMKAKKTLHHNDLINELFTVLNYPLEAS